MLKDFNIQKQLLVEKWNKILEHSKDVEYVQLTERIRQEIEKLQTSEFYLMVVGQFKRGKSRLSRHIRNLIFAKKSLSKRNLIRLYNVLRTG